MTHPEIVLDAKMKILCLLEHIECREFFTVLAAIQLDGYHFILVS